MNEEELKSQNLVRVSKTDLALKASTLVSRGLELAVELTAYPAKRQWDNVDWRALVCVKDERFLDLACAELTMHGYHTVHARHSAEMLELCKKQNFHLIVTDVGTHALATAEQIHQEDPAIPVITTRLIDQGVFFRPALASGWPNDHALSLLQRRSSTALIDPEMLKHLISRGSYHFEEGIWEFAEWSEKVLDDVGEWARPHLETMHNEISKIKRNFNQMLRVVYLDGLTEVHNRVFFGLRISEELERARRFEGRVSLISADIDFFKSLNDEFGHAKGNEILRFVSTILKQQMRKMDIVCRFSDDDFLIIVPETTADSAIRVAEKLRRTVEGQVFPGISRPVTISCGVADFPTHGTTREELVHASDAALGFAKSSGRNRVAIAAVQTARSSRSSL